MNTQFLEYSVTKSKLAFGIKYEPPIQEQVFLQKNIRFSVCGALATPMVSLWFHSVREAVAAMQGAENTVEVTRDKFDERRLDLSLSYVDSGLTIRHVIYAPEPDDHKKVQADYSNYNG